MVKSALRKKSYNIQILGVIFKKSSQILIQEAFFGYKMCHRNCKSIKATKENIPYICIDLSLLKICAKFQEK